MVTKRDKERLRVRLVTVDDRRDAAVLRRIDPSAAGVAFAGEGLACVGTGSIVLDHEGRIAGARGGAGVDVHGLSLVRALDDVAGSSMAGSVRVDQMMTIS